MPFKRKKLTVNEVSLVKNPANKGARVAFYKGNGTAEMTPEDLVHGLAYAAAGVHKDEHDDAQSFDEALGEQEARERAWQAMSVVRDMFQALERSLDSILGDDGIEDKVTMIEHSLAQFAEALDDAIGRLPTEESRPTGATTKRVNPMSKLNQPATKAKAYAAIQDQAATLRKSGETREQAIARYLKTAEGLEARAMYNRAEGPSLEPTEPAKKAADPILEVVEKKAAELRKKDPSLTEHQARARVWKSDPALRKRYDEKRQAEIKKLAA